MVFDMDRHTRKIQYNPNVTPITESEQLRSLLDHVHPWVPVNTKQLVIKKEKKRRQEAYYVVSDSRFEGRSDAEVTFPKNRLRIPARLVRMSDEHDVALIKVDILESTPSVEEKLNEAKEEKVPKVSLYDSYDRSRPGDRITVLGYPSVSPDVEVPIKSRDPLNPVPQRKKVPDLTVTDGLIGKIIRSKEGGDARDSPSESDDLIQLTVNATGAGNSGGPVFDDRGRVIGIFAYSRETDVKITFAVPIRFGLDIMKIKPVFN